MTIGAQLVQQAAQGPNVALLVVGFLLAQFRGEIEGSADHSLGKLVTGEHLGHPQISDFDLFVLVHEDVESFNIAMEYLVFVDVLQAHADLYENSPNLLLLQRLFDLAFQEVGEVTVVAVLHYDVESVVFDE